MKIKKSENNKNDHILEIFKLISSIIILLLIILQLECFLYFLLGLIFHDIIFKIILFIIFQYLLIHYIIESFLFLIQFPFFGKASFKSNGSSLAKELIKYLSTFIDICEKIVDNEKINLFEENIHIMEIYERINMIIYIFYEMKKRYGLSKYQKKFYDAIIIWRKHFNQFNVLKFFQNNKKSIEMNYNILFNKNLVILILDSNFIIKIAEDFICDEYHFLSRKKLFNYIFNDTFYSENQYKTEFCLKFKQHYNKFITKDNKVIDYVIIDAKKIMNIFNDRTNIKVNNIKGKKKYNKNNNLINNNSEKNIKTDESIISTISNISIISSSNINDESDSEIINIDNSINNNYIHIKKNNSKKNLIIFCNPNSMLYQFFTPEKYYFYYEGNCDILFYNYRGYGESDGYSTFDNVKSDILEIFDEITKWNKYEKIGVHGYSIGGIPATYLAKNRNIDLLVSDRNFSNVGNIVYSYIFGRLLKLFCKIFWIDRFNNDMNYLFTKNKNCIKIILCDSLDEVVSNNGSIKSSISRYLINKKNKKENILNVFLNDYEKNIFITSLLNIENFVKKNQSFKNNLIIINLSKFYECFSFGTDEVIYCNIFNWYRLKVLYIDNFFNNFFIWGTKNYEENLDANIYYKTENNMHYIKKAIDLLSLIQDEENDLSQLNNTENILNSIRIVKDGLIRIKNNIDKFQICDDINKGYIIRLSCGHNIALRGNNEKIMVKILKKEKFFE